MRKAVVFVAMVVGFVLTASAQVQGDIDRARAADREKMELIY